MSGRPCRCSPIAELPRSGLGPTAISAVQWLSAAAGHPLHLSAVSTPAVPQQQTDYGALIALAAGAVLIALAWIVSLRARPLRSRSA